MIGTHAAKSGHPGGSLGAADIITYLYFEEMNVDPADPRRADRDRTLYQGDPDSVKIPVRLLTSDDYAAGLR